MSNSKEISAVLIVLLSISSILMIVSSIKAEPLAKLYVDPPSIIDPTLMPPKTFDVNVTIDDIENMYAYEFNLSFNPAVLTCLYTIVNDVQGEVNYASDTLISNVKGFVYVETAYYSPAAPITSSTPLALVTIHFRVKAAGATILDLHDTNIIDPDGNSIPHDVQDGFIQTVIHDVAITSVTPASTWAYQGWLLSVSVAAKNLGNASESFDITGYYGTTAFGTTHVTDLAPNAQTTVTLTWNTTGVTAGNYTMSAKASIVPYETNTVNNEKTDGIVNLLALTSIRDVAITNVTPQNPWAYQGWLLRIDVQAANLGEQQETFNVSVFYETNLIGKITVTALAAHSTTDLAFYWNTTLVPYCHNYTISAEATIIPFEYNITNNALTDGKIKIRIVGDLNGDGKVDITDVAMVSAAFGSYPGHPRWNPAADINRDNRVDIQDMARVSANFGKHC